VAKKVKTRKSAAVSKAVSKGKPSPKAEPKPAKPVIKLKCPLSKSEVAEFRKLLLEKRRAILGDMSGIESEALRTNRQEGSGDLSNMPTHPADIGTDNFEQEFTLGLLESERTMLKEINEALERISSGTYGVCLGTGKPIGLARLRARPWAKYCIEYARLMEKGLVRPSDAASGAGGDDEEDEDDSAESDGDVEVVETEDETDSREDEEPEE
jgi:RNA polymerase-binding protein DksA